MGNNKFNALTSEVLNENNKIYTEALDYAFGNNDIKNIAITGIYGGGKSTVWNTYVNKRKLNNVINVSLGKYENYIRDDDNRQKEASETKLNNSDADGAEDLFGDGSKKAGGIDDENRVERQIINQILSQIDPNKIPLSKYCFKSNKSKWSIFQHFLAFLSMICSILLWKLRNDLIPIFKDLIIFNDLLTPFFKGILKHLFRDMPERSDEILWMIPCLIFFLLPLYYFFYTFYRGNKFRVSKISFNGTEADMDNDMGDETVLDRDIKELVYLLGSSGTEIVVFEDLDRYNDISIYTKLRELNFILNNYVKINGKNKLVRFIYLLKDGIFFSKNRTKFFDFIIPIVPIVNSFISEYHIDKFLRDNGIVEEVTILADVALYVDDMRLIKNIVNEYIIYSRILQLESKNSSMDASLEYSYLNNDMLFALITLKNILPNEFELLQEGRGYIKTIFDRLDSIKIKEKNKCNENEHNNISYKEIIFKLPDEKKDELFSKKGLDSLESRYFDFVRFLIVNGLLDNSYGKFIVDLYKADTSNILKRNDIIYIKGLKEGRSLDVLLDIETPDLIIKRLDKDDFMRDNILNINIFKTCLEKDMIDNVIAITESIIKHNKYDDLSKILDKIDLGLGGKYFNILLYNNENLFYKILDYFKSKEDFLRDNILNINVFKTCLENDMIAYVIAITESIIKHRRYNDLSKILDEMDSDLKGKYFNILLYNNEHSFCEILDYFRSEANTEFHIRELMAGEEGLLDNKYTKIFNDILISILITEHTGENQLKSLKKYLEDGKSTNIIQYIHKIYYGIYEEMDRVMECEDDETRYEKEVKCMNTRKKELDNFIKNVNAIGVEFDDISKIVSLKDDDIESLCR
jgi:hypothetical protein